MNVRTKVNSSHLVRLAIIGCFCVGFGLYCLYDGYIGYPGQQERAKEFIKFTEEHKALEPLEIANQWKVYAAEKEWPTGNPGEPKEDHEIAFQFVMAGATGAVGLIFVVQLFMWRGRWIEVNDSTITSSRGHQFHLDDIVGLDKKKWDKKGIAKVLYQTDGKNGRLVLDDCNYERDTTQKILRQIEKNIDHSKIVNGKPEPPIVVEEEAVSTPETA